MKEGVKDAPVKVDEGWTARVKRGKTTAPHRPEHRQHTSTGASMAAESDSSTPFDRLMGLNRAVFISGRYYMAYCTLAAALHEALERRDTDALLAVQQVAEDQLSRIDRMAPHFADSTTSAEAHGQVSLFALLAHQAHAHCQLIDTQRKRQKRFPGAQS
jgi:hypothetical protein